MEQAWDKDKVMREMKAFCAKLSEHTESVRIFVTLPGDRGTLSGTFGKGNYYAQIGQVQEWIDQKRDESLMGGFVEVGQDEDDLDGGDDECSSP